MDNRRNISPGQTTAAIYNLCNWIRGRTLEEIFTLREAASEVFRLDPSVWPVKYRCATVHEDEFHQLKRIENVVRLGRVVRIGPTSIELEQGLLPTDSTKLHVDCSANGLARRDARTVFDGERITLQSLSQCRRYSARP